MEEHKLTSKQHRYKIQEPIQNSEKVFLAHDIKLGREVVLKKLPKKNHHEFERFKRELIYHAQLDHPYIVPIFDVFETRDELNIVMKYVEGGSLKEKMKILKLEEFVLVFKKVLQALSYIHSEKILHRDIKPSNILLDKENHPYLIDFGILKLLDSEMTEITKVGTYLGTPLYSSPEQFKGRELQPSSDIYSLGMIFYEKLSGISLLASDSFQDKTNPLSFTPKPLSLPKPYKYLEKICLKMIEKDPQKRYGSCEEVLKDLEQSKNHFYETELEKKDKFILVSLLLVFFVIFYFGYNLYILKNQVINQNQKNHLSNKEAQEIKSDSESSTEKVHKETISNEENFSNAVKEEATVQYQIYYTTQEVNLREKPTVNSKRIKRLKKGIEVLALPVQEKELQSDILQEFPWYYDTKRKGYIYGKYLKPKQD